ncbi:MAG: transglutaminase family protein [Pseudomonadota bacterium]
MNPEPTHDFDSYLTPSRCINSDAPAIVAKARELTDDNATDLENALKLYYFVRDSVRYNPYIAEATEESLHATLTLETGEGWCVSKAVLLAALCRAIGIPARLGFADVVNHLSTERLRAAMQTDVFYFHGYCSIYLEGKWVKSTPAFNLSLCQKFNLHPLEFNGRDDSLYHEFDQAGNRHMEYINERGEYVDVPVDELQAVFTKYYGGLSDDAQQPALKSEQWDQDVLAENNLAASAD